MSDEIVSEFPSSPEPEGLTNPPVFGVTLDAISHSLLRNIVALISRYFVLTPAQKIVVGLWIIHTHLAQLAAQTPYIAVSSPEPRCGKSFLLELAEMLAYKGWYIIGPSEPVVFRTIHGNAPTLILDEYDTIFNAKTAQHYEGLRQMLNAGNRPGAKVPRCVGTSLTPRDFNVYCPKMLGGISRLPTTIADRSVHIVMQRKTRDEVVERFRKRRVKEYADELVPQIVAWAEEAAPSLVDAEPDLPEELNDRMQDACECLIAIADLLGDGELARQAIVEVAGAEPESHQTTRLQLLRDLRQLWSGWTKTNMPTKIILPALHALGAQWENYYGHGPLRDTELSSLLAYFDISPKAVWIPDGALALDGQPLKGHTDKGYKYDEFANAWARYLPPEGEDF